MAVAVAKHTPPSELVRTIQWASFPWLAAGLAVVVAGEVAGDVFGLPPQLRTWSFLFAMLVMAGGLYPVLRISAYRLRIDRTPRAAPWVETSEGKLLIQTLRRITLNALSHVTLDTRLKRDLWLTGADVSMLLTVLADECNLDPAT